MDPLSVNLFGVFSINGVAQNKKFSSLKVQELFAFLLLNPGKRHTREKLASLLWPFHTTVQSKANLRKVLWLLQQGLRQELGDDEISFLRVDGQNVKLEKSHPIVLDTAVFERVYLEVTQIPCENFLAENEQLVKEAVALYKGDLMENSYEEWCAYERERYKQLFLILLDKLVEIALTKETYAQCIDYGMRILSIDAARESTHRQLMRAYFLGGDRTSALRQYQKCETSLRDELGVTPEGETVRLYEQIKGGQFRKKTPLLKIEPDAAILKQMNILQHKLLGLQQEVNQIVDSYNFRMNL